jgi:hypothetical protein
MGGCTENLVPGTRVADDARPVDPTPARFAALARSSPWRWTTLRFVIQTRRQERTTTVRGWVGRPDRLRVEELDGTVLFAGRQPGPAPGFPASGPPMLDDDGFVSTPRGWPERFPYDAPMWQDYRWVAMLDPVELADGEGQDGELGPPVVVDALRSVEHHGRPAWEAVLRTTPFYEPRCSCCPLLLSADSDALETAGGVPSILERTPGLRFADAHRVRLDLGTGVCVFTAEIGGDRPGEGHDLRIEEVDGSVP